VSFIGTVRGSAVDADVYFTKYLPKMVKFVEKHHKTNDETIFLADLASCHYAKKTLEWLEQKNIKIVSKADNPTNVPQARPIENFWALLARTVYA
jgi:organic hydroperoxide reductase OsmC/OhrA